MRSRRSSSRRSAATALNGRCGSSRGTRPARSRRSVRRAARARPCSSGRIPRSSRRSSSTPTSSPSAWRCPATCTRASASSSRTKQPADKKVYQHTEGLADYLKKILTGADRGARPRGAVHDLEGERRERAQARPRHAVDAVDRRARQELRQRHPHRLRRHARERLPRRARQGRPQFHRHAQPVAQGRDARRRRHPRRPRRPCSACSSRSRSSRGRRRIG